jgi:hypothetical protein
MVKEEKTVKVLAERLQPGLTENERRLLSAAELGDGDLVRKLLESGEVSAEVLVHFNISSHSAVFVCCIEHKSPLWITCSDTLVIR